MQPGLHAFHGDAMVKTVRQTQVHGVNSRLRDQLLVRSIDRGSDAEQLFQHIRTVRRRLLIGIAHGRNDEVAAPALQQVLH